MNTKSQARVTPVSSRLIKTIDITEAILNIYIKIKKIVEIVIINYSPI